MTFEKIKRKHVIKAITEINKHGIPAGRQSTGYDLVYKGLRYPPKLVLGRANKHATGKELGPYHLYGGDQSNSVLKELGFKIKEKRKIEKKGKTILTKTGADLIEEGAEKIIIIKSKKRSQTLIKEARKYYRGDDKKLRCHACGYSKPSKVKGEIVQLHHTKMISKINRKGQKNDIKSAIDSLIPLCPTCHRIAHSSTPPLTLDKIKKIIK